MGDGKGLSKGIKTMYPPPAKDHVTPSPSDLPTKPGKVNATYKYPGLGVPSASQSQISPKLGPTSPSAITSKKKEETQKASASRSTVVAIAPAPVANTAAPTTARATPMIAPTTPTTPTPATTTATPARTVGTPTRTAAPAPVATTRTSPTNAAPPTPDNHVATPAAAPTPLAPATTTATASAELSSSAPSFSAAPSTTQTLVLDEAFLRSSAPSSPPFPSDEEDDPPPLALSDSDEEGGEGARGGEEENGVDLGQSRPRFMENSEEIGTGRTRREKFQTVMGAPSHQWHRRVASADVLLPDSLQQRLSFAASASSTSAASSPATSPAAAAATASAAPSHSHHPPPRLPPRSATASGVFGAAAPPAAAAVSSAVFGAAAVSSSSSASAPSSPSGFAASEELYESDEDDSRRAVRQETVASLSSKLSKPFTVVKGNKFGVKQNRVIAIDDGAMTLKFCDTSLRLKSEVPVALLSLAMAEDNDRKICLTFKQRSRVYELVFETAAACTAFVANFEAVSKIQQEQQRKDDAAMLNAFMMGEAPADSAAENKHQEFKILKKNRFRQKQQRILVLKPTSLALLDGDRKFIKAFPYELIYSMENSADDKNDSESFLVFHQSSGQRAFQMFFGDVFDRQLFSQSLLSHHRKLVILDGDKPSSVRFMVTKSNTAAANKGTHQRILEILGAESVLRSYDRIKHFKDTPFSAVRRIEACSVDHRRVFFEVQQKRLLKRFAFDFSDSFTRARFLAMATFALDSQRMVPPGQKISVFCGTWNVGGSAPSEEFFFLDQFIESQAYDIYAIGMQECPQSKRDDWVVEFQRHCGGHSREFAALGPAERKAQTKYEIVASSKLWEISVLVLVRKELAYKVTGVTEATVACGVGDLLGNKGAAVVYLRYEDTGLGFVVCHLAARAERIKERRQDFLKIVKGIRLGDKEVDIINLCDHLFWFGDLNYRVEKGFHDTIAAAEAKNYDELALCDQLRREMSKGPKDLVFPGFKEGRLAFAPTYRWEKSRNVFSNKREQAPSYTDRVLWHSLQNSALNLEVYGSAPDVLGSDHRPCYAGFTVSPRSFLCGGQDSSLEVVLRPLTLTAEEPELTALRLVITAPILRDSESCPTVMREVGALKWHWPEGVHMRVHIEKEYVAQQHLLVCVQGAQSQECLGYATIALAMNEKQFRVIVTKDGVLLGHLIGSFSVYPTPDDVDRSRRPPVLHDVLVD